MGRKVVVLRTTWVVLPVSQYSFTEWDGLHRLDHAILKVQHRRTATPIYHLTLVLGLRRLGAVDLIEDGGGRGHSGHVERDLSCPRLLYNARN